MEPDKFTKDDLKRWLDNFPKQLSDDRVIRDFWPLSPRGEALRRVAEIVYAFSAQKDESCAQTKDRLADAARLLLNVLSTVLPRRAGPQDIGQTGSADQLVNSLTSGWLDQDVWHHRDDLLDEFANRGYSSDENLKFRTQYISSLAADLIERPWLNSCLIEWLIVDSLVCDGVRQFGRSILESQHVGLRDLWAALFDESSTRRIKGRDLARHRVIRWLVRILLLFALPATGVWYGASGGNARIFIASAAIGAGYLLWSAYVTVRAEIIQLLGRELPKTALQQKLELFLLMNDAYSTLAGPVVDPNRAKTALDAAAEKGAAWNGAIYAILNRVIARDRTAWVTDDRRVQ